MKPQISHGVALAPPVPAFRLAALANEHPCGRVRLLHQINYNRPAEGLRFAFDVETCEQVTVRGASNASRTVILFASRTLLHSQLSKNNPSPKSW